MTDLPPLANFIALYEVAPLERERARSAMMASDCFTRVWAPVAGWLVGACGIPKSAPAQMGQNASIIPGEGLGQLLALHTDPSEALDRVERLAREHPTRLSEIPGDFMFVHLAPHGAATAVRACSGRVPVYVYADRMRSAVATRLEYLVRFLPVDFSLDRLATGIWLTGWYLAPDQRSLLADVCALQAGHFAKLAPGSSVKTARYWDPRPARWAERSERREREHAVRLREELLRALERELSSSTPNLLWLSGGVDSSALAYLARRNLGKPLATLTFLSGEVADRERDLLYLESLRRDLVSECCHDVILDAERYLEIAQSAPETCYPVRYFGVNALSEVLNQTEVRVVFGGEFADEVGGSHRLYPDWLAATPPWKLPLLLGDLPKGKRTLLNWAFQPIRRACGHPFDRTPKRLDEIVHPHISVEYDAWRARRLRRIASDRRPYGMLAAAIELNGWLADFWEGATSRGVRPYCPFYSRELLELAFECHPHEQLGSDHKRLLRRALHSDVPAMNLYRRDKARWSGSLDDHAPWHGGFPEALESVIRPDLVEAHGPTLSLYRRMCLTVLTGAVKRMGRCRQPT